MCKRCQQQREEAAKAKARQAIQLRRDTVKGHADYFLTIDKMDCEEWNTLISMANSSEEDLVLAEELILSFRTRLQVTMPTPGSKINWWGTEYTVDAVEGRSVRVTLNNGLKLELYWWATDGCRIIKKEKHDMAY